MAAKMNFIDVCIDLHMNFRIPMRFAHLFVMCVSMQVSWSATNVIRNRGGSREVAGGSWLPKRQYFL